TPLAVLRTHVELLNRLESRTPAGRAIVQGIDTAVRKLQRLLVQLISLARAEELIDDRATTSYFDLGELAAEVAREFVDNSLTAGVKLSLEECSKNRSVVFGDPILAEK